MVDNWDELSGDEKQKMSSLNNFFCGLHLLVGMANTASSTLLQWEIAHFENSVSAATLFDSSKKSESGIIRLIRTACKALSKHGSEQTWSAPTIHFFSGIKRCEKEPSCFFQGKSF